MAHLHSEGESAKCSLRLRKEGTGADADPIDLCDDGDDDGDDQAPHPKQTPAKSDDGSNEFGWMKEDVKCCVHHQKSWYSATILSSPTWNYAQGCWTVEIRSDSGTTAEEDCNLIEMDSPRKRARRETPNTGKPSSAFLRNPHASEDAVGLPRSASDAFAFISSLSPMDHANLRQTREYRTLVQAARALRSRHHRMLQSQGPTGDNIACARLPLKKPSEGPQDDNTVLSSEDDSDSQGDCSITDLSTALPRFEPRLPVAAAATMEDSSRFTMSGSTLPEDNEDCKLAAKPSDYQLNYDKAMKELRGRYEEERVRDALELAGYPFGLQNVTHYIRMQEARWAEPQSSFQVKTGMLVKKRFNGTPYYGKVTSPEEGEDCVDPQDGQTKKMWRVTYHDGDVEDLTFDDLYRYQLLRPRTAAPCLGRQMGLLELFSGRGIISQEFLDRKWKVASVDNSMLSNATIKKDIMELDVETLPFCPDCIWISLPCRTYSKLAGGKHRSPRKGELDKTGIAHQHNDIFIKTWKIMRWAKEKHEHCIFVIENPDGLLGKMPMMHDLIEEFHLGWATVNYCAFGRDEKKPTTLWTNDRSLTPELQPHTCKATTCRNHGSTHPMGVRNNHHLDFSAIPQPLAELVAKHVDFTLYEKRIRLGQPASPNEEER